MLEKYKLKLNGINNSQLFKVSEVIKKLYGNDREAYQCVLEKPSLERKNDLYGFQETVVRLKKRETKTIKVSLARRMKREGKQFLSLITLLRSPFVFKSTREQFKKTMFTACFSLRMSSGLKEPFVRGSRSKMFQKQQYILKSLNYNNHLLKNFAKEQYGFKNLDIYSRYALKRMLTPSSVCKFDNKVQKVPTEFIAGALGTVVDMLPNGVQLTVYKKQYENIK